MSIRWWLTSSFRHFINLFWNIFCLRLSLSTKVNSQCYSKFCITNNIYTLALSVSFAIIYHIIWDLFRSSVQIIIYCQKSMACREEYGSWYFLWLFLEFTHSLCRIALNKPHLIFCITTISFLVCEYIVPNKSIIPNIDIFPNKIYSVFTWYMSILFI